MNIQVEEYGKEPAPLTIKEMAALVRDGGYGLLFQEVGGDEDYFFAQSARNTGAVGGILFCNMGDIFRFEYPKSSQTMFRRVTSPTKITLSFND